MSTETLKDARYGAERLKLSLNTFYEIAAQGILPPGVIIRLGRRVRVNPKKLDEFIETGGVGHPANQGSEAA